MKTKNKSVFKVKELRNDVYAITNATVNMYLLIGSSHALLFDTGYGFANVKECVEEITNLPLYVVNSHGHIDHSGGNNAFDGPIYIHETDLELYHTHNSPKLRKIGLDGIRSFQKILFWMKLLPKKMDGEEYINKPYFDNFAFVKEGEIFDLGGMTAEVFEIPGHTQGSIGLLIKEKRLFLASDAINGLVWLFLPESTKLSVYQQSIRKVEKLDFDYLITGHSSELLPKTILKDYKAVANYPDFENGKQQRSIDFAPGVIAKRCWEKGNNKKKRQERNKASIVISEDKL